MFLAPHQVALHCDQLDAIVPAAAGNGTRWTWIAGRRFRGVRRL